MSILKKISGGNKFFLGVGVIYLASAIFNFSATLNAFQNFTMELWHILPILFFSFLAMFVIDLLVKPELIKKHLGKDSGWKGWFYVILASVIISGPPYILFPLFGELKKHGMRNSLLAVFFSDRNVQLVFLPVLAHYFGLFFTVIVAILITIFSIINGLIIERWVKE